MKFIKISKLFPEDSYLARVWCTFEIIQKKWSIWETACCSDLNTQHVILNWALVLGDKIRTIWKEYTQLCIQLVLYHRLGVDNVDEVCLDTLYNSYTNTVGFQVRRNLSKHWNCMQHLWSVKGLDISCPYHHTVSVHERIILTLALIIPLQILSQAGIKQTVVSN